MNIKYTPYSPEYFDFIFELNKKETSKFRSDIEWDKIAYQNNINSGIYGEIFVILEGQIPVGFYSIHKNAESIYLHKIFIAEKHQRLGLGSNVVKFLKSKFKTIECQANVQNQRSINFFINQGFQIKEEKKDDIRLVWKI